MLPSTLPPIPMASADLDESDIEAVVGVLRSGRLALGDQTPLFEGRMAEYIGVRHAIALSSGTAALHLIALALDLGPGDEVLAPSFTFAASVNAILFVGATPVFVDILPDTYSMDPQDMERKITCRTRAIMVVDVFGHPAEWDAILALAERYGLKIIDDSCEALGATYKGRKIGGFGDAAAFAFYPNKQMTTGEGGMLVTNSDEIARIARSLRNQGRSEMGAWLEHERLGYNYRMDEMSAALGASQLLRIETFLARRERVAQAYSERLTGIEWLDVPQPRPEVRMSWFVYVVTLKPGLTRDPILAALQFHGIPARGYFSPIHRQPYIIQRLGALSEELPVTDSAAHRTIALPFHNHLTEAEIDRVVNALSECILPTAA